jgi:hypothetical protein
MSRRTSGRPAIELKQLDRQLQQFTMSRNIVPANESASYYLVAELDWTDMAALQRAFQSPEGQAIGQDMANNLA